MNLLPKNADGCPFLILAPMEGVGDSCFRKAIASIGGFDEAVRDFIRVPSNAHVKSLALPYDCHELGKVPLAAQLMGGDPELMAEMALEIEKRGAKRIDLNCGCPSNTVTGRGAGSSLLKDPGHLYTIAKAMVKAVAIPVTAKLRSGFADTALFKENLLAVEESGISFLTLHPRTKEEGYLPPAKWELIAEAKSILKIPVVGNGDILTPDDALKMVEMTNCDALMIGRGSVINPFLFHQIKARFSKKIFKPCWSQKLRYLEIYLNSFSEKTPEKNKVNKMKQMFGFLFKANSQLMAKRQKVLQSSFKEVREFLDFAIPLLEEDFSIVS